MPNASPNVRRPNMTYIPPPHVGGTVMQILGFGLATQAFKIHVGIPSAKFSRTPNARDFALQWNIGLSHTCAAAKLRRTLYISANQS